MKVLLQSACVTVLTLALVGSVHAEEDKANQTSTMVTPMDAIALVQAEPLEFIVRFDGRDIGLFAPICLFKNKQVLLRLNYCSVGPGTERRGDEVTGMRIYLKDGQEVRIYAEMGQEGSIFEAPREHYLTLRVEYYDWSELFPDFTFDDIDEDSYSVFAKTGYQSRDKRVCYGSGGSVRCKNLPDSAQVSWASAVNSFVDAPPQDWYAYLTFLKALRDGIHTQETKPTP